MYGPLQYILVGVYVARAPIAIHYDNKTCISICKNSTIYSRFMGDLILKFNLLVQS